MSTGVLGGLTFILVFAGIILLHEMGHFVVARLLGIEIEEFGIGFPPRLVRLWRGRGSILIGKQRLEIPYNYNLPFDPVHALHRPVDATADSVRDKLVLRTIDFVALEDGQIHPDTVSVHEPVPVQAPQPSVESGKHKGKALQPGVIPLSGIVDEIRPGTEISLNWLPLGGFVRPKGENDPDIRGGLAAAKPAKRIAVLIAGAFLNLLTAVFAYSLLFNDMGLPDTHTVVIAEVSTNSPAEQAGLLAGDIIVNAGDQQVGTIDQLRAIIHQSLDQPLELTVQRDGQNTIITVTPSSQRSVEEGATGVLLANPIRPAGSWFETLPYSFETTVASIRELLALPGRLIAGTISPQEAQVAGPRSLWNLFQQAVARDVESRQSTEEGISTPTYYTLSIIISLTLTVGIINLLPIPAFDGGRIFFALIELIFRKRVPPRLETVVHTVGFFIAIALIGYVYIADFINPVNFNLP